MPKKNQPGCPCCHGHGHNCPVKVCVTGCPSGSALVGATVAIVGAGSCRTIGDGKGHACCSLNIGVAGTYTLTVSATGYTTYTGSLAMKCGQTIDVALQPVTAPSTICFDVKGCCSAALAGALVRLSDGQSCTTDASGQCCISEGTAGTYGYTVSKSRFIAATGSVTISACQATTATVNVTLSPESGYVCGILADPMPTTLNLTDSVYGATILIYDFGLGLWQGTLANFFPGGCGCPGAPFTITYTLALGDRSSCAWGLGVFFNACQYVQCNFGVLYSCPSDPTGLMCVNPFNMTILTNCSIHGAITPGWIKGGSGFVLSPIVPFDLVATIDPCNCTMPGGGCTVAGNHQSIAWNGGGMLTITE